MNPSTDMRIKTLAVDGRLPEAVLVVNLNNEHRTYVPEKTATHMIVNSGTTGHCACTGCGDAIDPWDRFCKHCGARLEGGWK